MTNKEVLAISVQTLLTHLHSLLNLHEQLLEVSAMKTDLIKENKVDDLAKILMREKRLVQAIEQVETERAQTSTTLYNQFHINADDPSLVELINQLRDEGEKEQLLETMTILVETITKLKANEALNKQLLEQSMQFVQLSLSMVDPSMDSLNYGEKPKEKQKGNRSVFDSKA